MAMWNEEPGRRGVLSGRPLLLRPVCPLTPAPLHQRCSSSAHISDLHSPECPAGSWGHLSRWHQRSPGRKEKAQAGTICMKPCGARLSNSSWSRSEAKGTCGAQGIWATRVLGVWDLKKQTSGLLTTASADGRRGLARVSVVPVPPRPPVSRLSSGLNFPSAFNY